MKIIVDSREPVEERQVLTEHGIEFETQTLETGDYVIHTDDNVEICMERKEMKDLISSLFSGRLDNQMRRLGEKDHPILLVTGSFSEYYEAVLQSKGSTRFTKDQLLGAIASIAVRYNIQLLWIAKTTDHVHNDGLKLGVKMIQKIAQGKFLKPKPPRIKKTNKKQDIVRTLFSVSPGTANELMKTFGSIKRIINASDDELLKVKGIGKISLDRMKAIIDE